MVSGESKPSLWFVRATQREVATALDGRIKVGQVSPDDASGWVVAVIDGGEACSLLPDREQLQFLPLPDTFALVGRTQAGERLAWVQADGAGQALDACAAAIGSAFGGSPHIVGQVLLAAGRDAASFDEALRRVVTLPGAAPVPRQVPAAPLIAYNGTPRALENIGRLAGPSHYRPAGSDGWALLALDREAAWSEAKVLATLSALAGKEGRAVHPFVLAAVADTLMLRVAWEPGPPAAAVLGPVWRPLGEDTRKAYEREDRLVDVLSRFDDRAVVRGALSAVQRLPGRAGVQEFLRSVGLPGEVADVQSMGLAELTGATRLEHVPVPVARRLLSFPAARRRNLVLALTSMVVALVFLLGGVLLEAAGQRAVGSVLLVLGGGTLACGVALWKAVQSLRPAT